MVGLILNGTMLFDNGKFVCMDSHIFSPFPGLRQNHYGIYQQSIVLWCLLQDPLLRQHLVLMEEHLHQHSKLMDSSVFVKYNLLHFNLTLF